MPVKVDQPPLLSDFPSGRYAISGNVWIRVPADTAFADLDRYMTWKRPEMPSNAPAGVWAVVGSKGASYTVRARQGRYTCTCAGFGWRGKCKHSDKIRSEQS